MPRIVVPGSFGAGASADVSGFREAQERLRDKLGADVTFRTPTPSVWPAGTPLDPQTGRPYDPTVEPTSGGGFADAMIRVGLVFRPIRVNVEDPVGADVSGGTRQRESIALSVSQRDFPGIVNATRVNVGDIEYKITQVIRDPGLDLRRIIFAEAR